MSIAGFDRRSFEKALKQTLSPTTPIRSAEFLRGRDKKLEDIRRAVIQPGRHIFIYGDRGVGKTSLAQTAAFEHQSAEQSPILLACDPSSGFYRILRDLASKLLAIDPTATKVTTSTKKSAGYSPILSADAQNAVERGKIPEVQSINEGVALVEFVARRHSQSPVAVIDEFERIRDPVERTLFADFIKQVGDQSIPITLVFCGVGAALEELLDAHHSCYRYLTSIELERLGYDPRFEIIDAARNALELHVDETTRFRIAAISDGFPHYVHLITEKLMWEVYEDPLVLTQAEARHFTAAIKSAVQDIEPHLKATYDLATQKYSDEYEEVLWAVADHHELKRRSSAIFNSYTRIMRHRAGRTPLARDRFNARINMLKRSTHGAILKANRQGWYAFNENILRGYVRLRAEEQGVQLDAEHPLEARLAG